MGMFDQLMGFEFESSVHTKNADKMISRVFYMQVYLFLSLWRIVLG